MSETIKKVAILSPGDMGGATGGQLHNNGLEVYTCLEGRSALTRQIATEAGFIDAPDLDDLVKTVDLVLSILVPSQAVGLAESVAAAMKRTGATPSYADCHGLTVKVVGPRIGQASGLKMVYAASTKGTTALWTELMVAARAMGLEESLMAEFGDNHPIVQRNLRSIPGMAHKAGRWVGEMEEIAATFEGLGMTPKILEGAADMYRFVKSTPLGSLTSRDPHPSLDEVFDTLAANRGE
jgi:3-hydroxyisobutyrate dehydrogenase-like beta-hydroxyacid dehydrogenase